MARSNPPVTYGAGAGPASLVAGDFTGNGKLDLAVADPGDVHGAGAANDPGGVYVLLGNGNGTFQTATEYASGAGQTVPGSIVAGDFTGNGKLDLAVASDGADELLILPGNGDGTFQPPIGTPLDLPASGGLSIFRSWPAISTEMDASTWPSPTPPATTSARRRPLATARRTVLRSCWATATAHSSRVEGPRSEVEPRSAISADFNGDGNLDLATYNYATDEVSILLGNGGGGFQLASQFASGVPMVADDFNGDGRIDLATAAARRRLHPAG